jgi:beta-N-acetylhexosaminidase
MSEPAAIIFGWRKATLDDDAAAFFRAANPWGFILMGEACENRAQVRLLVEALQDSVGRQALVMIDQEGGRVARLKPPEWPAFPPAQAFGALYARDPEIGLEACALSHRLMAHELFGLGVRADCAPVLDLVHPGAHGVIGDRAFSADPEAVAALGKAALTALADGGVVGVVKHIPGHGRALSDSHHSQPRVQARREALAADFAPFKALAHAPMAMTAHLVYEAFDDQAPATLSATVIAEVVRGAIGFDGLLISDDLGMAALSGDWWEKAERALQAGCDMLLHCESDIAEMERIVMATPALSGLGLARAQRVDGLAQRPPNPFDAHAARADLDLYLSDLED